MQFTDYSQYCTHNNSVAKDYNNKINDFTLTEHQKIQTNLLTFRIFCSWFLFSTMITLASQFSATKWQASGEFVV